MTRRTCISMVALSLVFATACSKDKGSPAEKDAPGEQPRPLTEIPGPAGNTGARLDNSLLAYVPADSPFLVAMLQPMPNEMIGYLQKGVGPLMDMAQTGLTMAKSEEDMDPVGRALLSELDGKLSRKGLESLGISIQPRMVFYAIGWSLAMRLELADGKRLAATIDRIEQKSGSAMSKASLGNISYREFVKDDVALVLAVIDNYLVVGVMHANARDKVLPVLLGQKKPAKSMAEAGTVRALVDKYKLMGIATSFVDSQAVVRLLTGQATGLSKEIMDASKVDLPELSQVCRDEFTAMAQGIPRVVIGYQSAGATGYEGLMSIELRPDLAKELAALQTPSLDLGKLTAGKPLIAMGAAMELDKAYEWVRGTAARMSSQPYRCEYLQELNQGVAEMAEGVAAPLPPFVSGAHGFGMVLKDLQMTGFTPTGHGFVALGVADPMALVNLAKGQIPPLAKTEFNKGKAVEVPLGLPGLDKVTVLVKDRWVGVAVGSSMVETMTSFLKSGGSARSPFMVFGYDYPALLKMISEMKPGDVSPMDKQLSEIMGSIMGYNTMSVYFTESGLLLLTKNQAR